MAQTWANVHTIQLLPSQDIEHFITPQSTLVQSCREFMVYTSGPRPPLLYFHHYTLDLEFHTNEKNIVPLLLLWFLLLAIPDRRSLFPFLFRSSCSYICLVLAAPSGRRVLAPWRRRSRGHLQWERGVPTPDGPWILDPLFFSFGQKVPNPDMWYNTLFSYWFIRSFLSGLLTLGVRKCLSHCHVSAFESSSIFS